MSVVFEAITPILLALIALGGPILVYRQNKRAAAAATQVEKTKGDAAGFREVREGYSQLLAEVRNDREQLKERVATLEDRDEHRERAQHQQATEIRELRVARESDRRIIGYAIRHIRELRQFIANMGLTPPLPPDLLQHEIDA